MINRPTRGFPASYNYRLFGLGVQTNVALPGLDPSPVNLPVDIAIELLGGDGAPVGPVPPDSWKPISPKGSVAESVTSEGRYLRLRYEASGYLVVLVFGPGGKRVWVTWNDKVPFASVAALVLGSNFGLVLRLYGRTVLHGSAVAIDGKVVVFLGGKGVGKTTTALALVRLGATLVTDDLVALIETPSGFQVPPGPPSLRLLPDSAQSLRVSYDGLRLLGNQDMPLRKRVLDMTHHDRTTTTLPLDSMYLLAERASDGPVCTVTEVGSKEALAILMANRMCQSILSRDEHARDFTELSRLIRQVPIRRLIRREGLEGLEVIARKLFDRTAQVTS